MPNIKMVKQIKMKIILLRHNHSKFHFRFYKFASFWERQTTRIFCVAELFRISFFPDNFVSWKKKYTSHSYDLTSKKDKHQKLFFIAGNKIAYLRAFQQWTDVYREMCFMACPWSEFVPSRYEKKVFQP